MVLRSEEVQEKIDKREISYSPPKNAFFFATYREVRYWYFKCDGNNDPAVYLVESLEEKTKKNSNNLSSFLIEAIESTINKIKDVQNYRSNINH